MSKSKSSASANFVTPVSFDIERFVVKKVSTKKGEVPFEMVDVKYLYGPKKEEDRFMVRYNRCYTFGVKECYAYLKPRTPENKTGDFEMTFVPYSKEWADDTKRTEYDVALEKMNKEIIEKVRKVCSADEDLPAALRKTLKAKLSEEDYVESTVGGVAPMFSWQKIKREEGDKRKELPINPAAQKMLNTKIIRYKARNGNPERIVSVFRKPKSEKNVDPRSILGKGGDAVPVVIFDGYFVKGADKLCPQQKLNNVTFSEKARETVVVDADDGEFSDEEEEDSENEESEGESLDD